jgi:cell division protein FtsW
MRRRVDVRPAGPVSLPDTGLGRGWEPAVIMTATLLLLSFGLVTLYSASSFLAQRQNLADYFYVLRQAGGAALGLVVMVVCSRVPYTWWRSLAWPLVALTVLLLLLLILPGTQAIAPEVNGARRWLRLGVTVQPSELAKVAIVVWTAALAVRKQELLSSMSKGLLPFLLIWGVVCGLIALQPDLSTACLVGMLGSLIVFAAGGRAGHFALLGLLMTPFLWTQLNVAFRAQRLMAFLNPAADPSGAGFQVRQSLIAIGSGGITGVGFGEGRQKFGFLPEAHNDFIFAMVGEEWGLVGVVFLMSLYLTLILVGFRIAGRVPDLFGQLLAIGVTNLVAIQAVLHMGVGLGLVPPTGLTLPLVSYGRSSLIVTLAALGILMAVARGVHPERRKARA